MAEPNAYGRLDRLLHRVAFAHPAVQRAAAEIEDTVFQRDLRGVETGAPIFITSLPRAGTTTLLTALSSMSGLATHLYRDMPFVMAPMLWARLSERFRKEAALAERAHADGVRIGFDSPEAFEEVLWRAFWPGHYAKDGIRLWSAADLRDDARSFIESHFRKVVALRCQGTGAPGRYLSKNNANIARLDLLPAMSPGAAIVVPVRRPLEQAASLHRQHANFLKRHTEDPFALRYMRDIGHYEFGALHRPIRFQGFAALAEGLGPGDLDYWLAYWIAAFEHVARHRSKLLLVEYEDLCRRGGPAAAELCEALGLDAAWGERVGAAFRPVPPPADELAAHRGSLRDRAEALHRELVGR